MTGNIWSALNLRRASLNELIEGDAVVPQTAPRPLRLAFDGDERQVRHLYTIEDWSVQDPAERIVNAILLCAIRDGARRITVEPVMRGVEVRFTIRGRTHDVERTHLKLPNAVLEPILERIKTLARLDSKRAGQTGTIHLSVDQTPYHLQLSTHPTPWGERVELYFRSHFQAAP